MRRLELLVIWLVPLCFACHTVRVRPDVPAVIVAPSSQSHAALVDAVSAALDGVSVTLASDTLTRTSTLLVEKSPLPDPNGLPANGRALNVPERFQLVQDGTACILIHERSGKQFELAGTTCSATHGG